MGYKDRDTRKDKGSVTLPGNSFPEKKKKWEGYFFLLFFSRLVFKIELIKKNNNTSFNPTKLQKAKYLAFIFNQTG